MASETGKKFPGQVHLQRCPGGGHQPVSDLVSIGYASVAEMEAWTLFPMGNADCAACIEAARYPAAKPLGASLGRTVTTWGSGRPADLAAP